MNLSFTWKEVCIAPYASQNGLHQLSFTMLCHDLIAVQQMREYVQAKYVRHIS